MNMPQFHVVEGGKAKPKGKTGQALNELKGLLKLASADGKIDDGELRAIMTWRSNYRTVLRREPIKPFDDWLEEALADGQIDDKERSELVSWAEKLGEPTPAAAPAAAKPAVTNKTGDEYLAMPPSRRPSWKSDPATAKQIDFLLDLGESERACRGLTKGEASARIDTLLDQQRERQGGYHDDGEDVRPMGRFHVAWWHVLLALILLGYLASLIKR